jgi:hypothetical protein
MEKTQIHLEIAEENLVIIKKMREISQYLTETGEAQVKLAEEYLEKAKASNNDIQAQVFSDTSERFGLEAEENAKLAFLLNKKAMKFCDETANIIGD